MSDSRDDKTRSQDDNRLDESKSSPDDGGKKTTDFSEGRGRKIDLERPMHESYSPDENDLNSGNPPQGSATPSSSEPPDEDNK